MSNTGVIAAVIIIVIIVVLIIIAILIILFVPSVRALIFKKESPGTEKKNELEPKKDNQKDNEIKMGEIKQSNNVPVVEKKKLIDYNNPNNLVKLK